MCCLWFATRRGYHEPTPDRESREIAAAGAAVRPRFFGELGILYGVEFV